LHQIVLDDHHLSLVHAFFILLLISQALRLLDGEPADVLLLDLLHDVGLDAVLVLGVHELDVVDVEEVIPHFVVPLNVSLEAALELFFVNATDEAL